MKYLATISKLMFGLVMLLASTTSTAFGQVILENDLRSGTAPTDWTATDIDFRDSAGGYALFEAATSELESPSFDLTGITEASLTFQVAKFGSGDDGPLTVEVSTDGGTTWDAQTYTSPTPTSSTYQEGEMVLDSAVLGEADVRIRFNRPDSPSSKRLRDVVVAVPTALPDPIAVSTIAELRNGATDGTRYELTGEALVHFSDGFQGRRMLVDGTAGIWSVDFDDSFADGTTIGDGVTGLVGTLNLTNSDALLRFELDEGSADATVSSTGNTITPETITIPNLTLDDTGKLALIEGVTFQETGTFDTGENYTLEDGNGNTLTFRTDYFGADYIGEPIPTGELNVTGVVGGFGSSAQVFARSAADLDLTGAGLQIIHNSPDPAVSSVDIFVNGESFLTDVDFRTATSFLQVPSGVELSIEIAPAGAGIGAALDPIAVTLTEDQDYIAVASGVLDPSQFTFGGTSAGKEFSLEVFTPAQREAADPATVDLLVQHGAPDVPAVDIYLQQTGSENPAISDLSFPDFVGYTPIAADNEVIDIALAGGDIVASYLAPLADLNAAGSTITVLASGFFLESNASADNSLALIAVLADGTVLTLDEDVPSASLQIIHNSPDPAVSNVDIFVNGELAYGDVNFREATAFDFVPAGTELSIEIAPAGAGIENALDPIAVTLTEDESYIAVASGVIDPSAFTDASAFSLELFTGAKTTSADENGVEVNVHHGSPDAPNVDIYLEQTGSVDPAIADLAYPAFTGYTPLAASDELIGIAGAGGDVLLEFPAPLTAFQGEAVAVLASGFFSESNVSTGNGFGLLVVQADGSATFLPALTKGTIAELRAADEGSIFEIEGVVSSTDFGFSVADYFVQDETAGINVTDFDAGGNRDGVVVTPGDSIRIVGERASFRNQQTIEVSEFEILNSGNDLPTAQVITADEYNAESALQGSRVTLQNVTLTEASESDWPTEAVSSGSGVNVTFENAAGETFIVRIARNNTFYGAGSPVPTGPVNITGSLGQFDDDTQLFPFFDGDVSPTPTQVQIIHNSPDPAVASVDIYIDGELTLEDIAFRTATGFIELPSNTAIDIGVTPTGQPLSSGVTFLNNFFAPGNYYAVASGVLDPSGFAANPSGEDTDFFLDVIPNAVTSAPDEDTFSFRINHGSPDAPAVDISARNVAPLADNVVFGTTTADYANVPAASYTIDIAPAGGEVLASFEADANALGGESALVLASGFLTPSANQDGPAFGALLVLADGTTALLPGVSTSIDEFSDMPQEFALEQNYPNPFNPTTQIEYALPQAANVQISVYNVVGQRVATLLNNEQQSAGFYSIPFDASNLASGMYLYRIQAGNFIQTRKMTLIK